MTMPLRLLAPAGQTVDLTPMTAELEALAASIVTARNEAAAADARAANAQTMVRNRDAKLDQASTDAATAVGEYATLQQLAASYSAALPASVADRATLHANDVAQRAQIDSLTAAMAGTVRDASIGTLGVVAILLGGKATLTVPLATPMPTASYRVRISHSAIVDLTKVTITNVQRTTTAVTFTLTATGLALAAGTVTVLAVG